MYKLDEIKNLASATSKMTSWPQWPQKGLREFFQKLHFWTQRMMRHVLVYSSKFSLNLSTEEVWYGIDYFYAMVGILIDFRVFSVMIIDILHQKVCWDGDLQEGLHFAVVYIEDLLICLVVSSALVKKKVGKLCS